YHVLDAELGVPAAACIKAEIEAAAAVAVGDLDKGRGLEAAADIAVEAQRLGGAEHDTRDRRRGAVTALAAVVRIARRDEVIVGIEIDARMPRAAMQRPALGELPLRLRVERSAVYRVVLVALERADDAVVVDEALAPLVHGVVLGAEREPHGCQIGEPAQRAT